MDRNNRRVKYLTGANTTFKAYGMNDEKKKKCRQAFTLYVTQPAVEGVALFVLSYVVDALFFDGSCR